MQPKTLEPADTVLRETRVLALFIIPFLVVAAVLLTVWPDHTDITFAWTIKPTMTPMMLAAAYIGGTYFFSRVAGARRWHAVKVGFWPVIVFASILCVATALHWDRFNHSHISFFAWAGLYFTTPFLVFAIWLRSRPQDTGQIDPGDVEVPLLFRLGIGGIGLVTLVVSVFLFALPALMISAWPWTLTPLTARVVSAMFALPGLVGLGMAVEPRWS